MYYIYERKNKNCTTKYFLGALGQKRNYLEAPMKYIWVKDANSNNFSSINFFDISHIFQNIYKKV